MVKNLSLAQKELAPEAESALVRVVEVEGPHQRQGRLGPLVVQALQVREQPVPLLQGPPGTQETRGLIKGIVTPLEMLQDTKKLFYLHDLLNKTDINRKFLF